MQAPETRYAERPDGVSIAYQVIGDGPLDLVFCFGFISHLDLQWANPDCTRFFRRLASFSRLILFDKAGTGLSDPITEVATLEERAQDIRTVMDAAGAERAALLGASEGGPSAMLFAAMYPERTAALVLYGSVVKGHSDQPHDEPWALSPEALERLERPVTSWGQGMSVDLFAPSKAGSALHRRGHATLERTAVSPSMFRALVDALKALDVTEVAKSVSVPALVVHRRGDLVVPISSGRYLASAIPGADYVELDGVDHDWASGESEHILDATQRFLTGGSAVSDPDRVLATVLFTDIVGSTERAAAMGDAAWRELLERHNELVMREASAAGGRVVDFAGDGALATFPGPARAIRCAETLLREMAELGIELRAGVHTGECEAMGDDLGGLAVHIGARVGATAQAGEILVSGTVKDLVVGSGLRFRDRGEHELRGVPGSWRLYQVDEGRDDGSSLTSPAEHMTRGDRVTVRLARHAPGAMRALAGLRTRRR